MEKIDQLKHILDTATAILGLAADKLDDVKLDDLDPAQLQNLQTGTKQLHGILEALLTKTRQEKLRRDFEKLKTLLEGDSSSSVADHWLSSRPSYRMPQWYVLDDLGLAPAAQRQSRVREHRPNQAPNPASRRPYEQFQRLVQQQEARDRNLGRNT